MAKSKNYWRARAKIAVEAGEKESAAVIQQTTSAWKSAATSVKTELNAFYGKYAKENKISTAETRRRLDPKALKSFKEQHAIYLSEIERLGPKAFTAQYSTYVKDLSAKAAVTRMDELNANLRYQYEKACCTENNVLGKSLSKSYKNGYYESMYGIQKGAGLSFNFSQPDTRAVDKAVSQKWLGENYSSRIWNDKAKQLPILEREIQQGIARGQSSTQIAKNIELRCGVSASNAKRLAITETTHIREQANADAYDEAGIESYEYDATMDGKTSEICISLNGMIFKLKDKSAGVNYPPMHPRCRSSSVPYFDDIVEDGIYKAGRGLGGKTELLPYDTTYSEWVKKYTPDDFAKSVKSSNPLNSLGTKEPTKKEVSEAIGSIKKSVSDLETTGFAIPERPANFPLTSSEKIERLKSNGNLSNTEIQTVRQYMNGPPTLNNQSEKHVLGTAQFRTKVANALKNGDNYPAVFLDGVDLNKVFDEYSFTGNVHFRNGLLSFEETETHQPIGVVFGNHENAKVSKVKIHYKQDGSAHMVPLLKKKN